MMKKSSAAVNGNKLRLLQAWFLGLDSSLDRILLLDGGVSTHLETILAAKGQNGFAHRELWSSSLLLNKAGHDAILQGHSDWIKAGANILSTVTYQCHYHHATWPPNNVLAGDAHMDLLWQEGVDLAHRARQEQQKERINLQPTFMMSSSGCYGAALANGAEYTGEYGPATVDDLKQFHLRKLQRIATLSPPVDAVALETVPSLPECHALAEILLDESVELPAPCFISLSCRNGHQLNDARIVSDALETFRSVPRSRLAGIGFNCCDSSYLNDLVELLVKEMAQHGPRTVIVYPNSGEEWDSPTQTWKCGTGCTTPSDMVDRLMEVVDTIERSWREQAKPQDDRPRLVVGGCCRTTPATIAALRVAVDAHLKKDAEAS